MSSVGARAGVWPIVGAAVSWLANLWRSVWERIDAAYKDDRFYDVKKGHVRHCRCEECCEARDLP